MGVRAGPYTAALFPRPEDEIMSAKTSAATDSATPKQARTAKSRSRRRKGESSPAAEQEPAIDEVLRHLEGIVKELEEGELPLEAALERFEHGVRLARQGSALLDAVEQRVEVLLEGRDATAPFAGAAPEGHEEGHDDGE